MLFRRFSKFFSYTHEKLVKTCKDLSSLPETQLNSYFIKHDQMKQFFDSVPRSARSMQTSEINEMCQYLSKFKTIDSISPSFWKSISAELIKRNKELELEDMIGVIQVFTTAQTDSKTVREIFKVIGKEVEETDWSELKLLKLSELEGLLASYTLKNVGSAMFYHVISETLLVHPDFPSLKYQHLARLAYYFARTPTSKERASKFIQEVEYKLWNGIHHGRINEMEQITGVINYIIPGNIGSNDLRSLLEFTLFRFLAEPKNQITIARLSQVISAFTHYIIKYKPLDALLKQLVKDSLSSMNTKEIIQILWSYCRHNKAESEFVTRLVKQVMEKSTESPLPFRHFTYFINSIVNSGIEVEGLNEFIDSFSVKSMESQIVQDHYLVKGLCLVTKGQFLDQAKKELMDSRRLPPNHPQDLSRTFLAVLENPNLQSDEFIEFLISKVQKAAEYMKPSDISRIAYTLARLNKSEPKNYELLVSKILQSDLTRMPPINLAIASLAFGLVTQENFCVKALPAINDLFHRYQKIEYDDYSDSDTDENTGKLILLNTQDLEFTSELPASAVVQLAWLVASVGVKDREFWNEKLINKLKSVQKSDNPYLLNPWIWTAKTLRDEEDFITGVDTFHYALLTQVLNLILPEYSQTQYRFVKNSPEFLNDVSNYINKANVQVDTSGQFLSAGGKQWLLYENEHYTYKSKGYLSQNSREDLLGTIKVERMILESKKIPYVEIFRGNWVCLSPSERAGLIRKLLDDNN